jgi:hypothetical protein
MNEDFSKAADRAAQLAVADLQRKQSIELAVYTTNTSRLLEAIRAGNNAGSEALKAVTLLNGGAAVALLAFVGHLASIAAPRAAIHALRTPLVFFVAGTFLAGVATAIGYFA